LNYVKTSDLFLAVAKFDRMTIIIYLNFLFMD